MQGALLVIVLAIFCLGGEARVDWIPASTDTSSIGKGAVCPIGSPSGPTLPSPFDEVFVPHEALVRSIQYGILKYPQIRGVTVYIAKVPGYWEKYGITFTFDYHFFNGGPRAEAEFSSVDAPRVSEQVS